MSVSLWAYEPTRCDGRKCCGDCDSCTETFEDMTVECDPEDEDKDI